MPFFDPKTKNFKVMYLQDFRPNQAGTYHPIWAVETSDGANYQSLGELIHCGGINEQDAALGTGSTVYNVLMGCIIPSIQVIDIKQILLIMVRW